MEYDDLYQLASMGLLKAINGFDESFGVRFSTYAVPMIAGEISTSASKLFDIYTTVPSPWIEFTENSSIKVCIMVKPIPG